TWTLTAARSWARTAPPDSAATSHFCSPPALAMQTSCTVRDSPAPRSPTGKSTPRPRVYSRPSDRSAWTLTWLARPSPELVTVSTKLTGSPATTWVGPVTLRPSFDSWTWTCSDADDRPANVTHACGLTSPLTLMASCNFRL